MTNRTTEEIARGLTERTTADLLVELVAVTLSALTFGIGIGNLLMGAVSAATACFACSIAGRAWLIQWDVRDLRLAVRSHLESHRP